MHSITNASLTIKFGDLTKVPVETYRLTLVTFSSNCGQGGGIGHGGQGGGVGHGGGSGHGGGLGHGGQGVGKG